MKQPDRIFDALIAEKVMDLAVEWWEPVSEYEVRAFGYPEYRLYHTPIAKSDSIINVVPSVVPNYSTDIRDAWKVVDRMKKTNNLYLTVYTYNRAYAYFGSFESGTNYSEANGDNCVPKAICLAALQALGVNIDEMS